MEQMIDYLRDNTIFARHSRAETRLFLERLEADGYEFVKHSKDAENDWRYIAAPKVAVEALAPAPTSANMGAAAAQSQQAEIDAASHD